jgi:hypothetical protein
MIAEILFWWLIACAVFTGLLMFLGYRCEKRRQ